MIALYEENERPPNAIDYMKRFLGAPVGLDAESLKMENEKLKELKAELLETIERLNEELTGDA